MPKWRRGIRHDRRAEFRYEEGNIHPSKTQAKVSEDKEIFANVETKVALALYVE